MTMQRSFSWMFALVGLGLFLSQAGEIVIGHDTWGEVFSPHGVGDLMKVGGTAIMAVLGYMGIRNANAGTEGPITRTVRKMTGTEKE